MCMICTQVQCLKVGGLRGELLCLSELRDDRIRVCQEDSAPQTPAREIRSNLKKTKKSETEEGKLELQGLEGISMSIGIRMILLG